MFRLIQLKVLDALWKICIGVELNRHYNWNDIHCNKEGLESMQLGVTIFENIGSNLLFFSS